MSHGQQVLLQLWDIQQFLAEQTQAWKGLAYKDDLSY
jgi:hypothetical protein